MRRRERRIVLLLLLTAMPALAQGTMTQRMAGTWFGTGQPNDKTEMYIDHFSADGGFRNQHRWCRQGKVAQDLSESGRWRMSGDTLTIDIATVNDRPEPRSDVYRVTSVDGRSQNYVYLANNFAYHAHKVAADFPMPPCDLTS
jgi:hypothetical protein